jgi:hypothetical protein
MLISADDYILDKKAFAIAHSVLTTHPNISLLYSAWNQVDDDWRVQHTRRAAPQDYVVDGIDEFRRLLMSSPVLHSGAMIRRDAYREVGGYDSRYSYSVDTNMWLALCSTGKVAYINQLLFAYRAHATNLSNSEGAFWQATQEMLWGIDTAFARIPETALPDRSELQKRAKQRALVAVPTLDIFAGRIRRGWAGFWQSFRHMPRLTLLQSRTVILVLRTMLGETGFASFRDAIKRIIGRP